MLCSSGGSSSRSSCGQLETSPGRAGALIAADGNPWLTKPYLTTACLFVAIRPCTNTIHVCRKSHSFVSHLHVQLLLQPAHCSDVTPISKPDERFACPEDTEYNPVQDLMLEPNAKKCCKVGSKTRLIDSQK